MKRIYQIVGACVLALNLITCGSPKGSLTGTKGDIEVVDIPNPEPEREGNGGNGSGSMKLESTAGGSRDAGSNETPVSIKVSETEIEWLDFETAVERNEKDKKFIFIDIYTDWCGWCKKMDQSTFRSAAVVGYMKEHFYAVKMNAESKEAIAYKEVLYEPKKFGSKMYNELAVNLLSGKMSFPSFAILNKREVKRGLINGYQTTNQLLTEMKRYVE